MRQRSEELLMSASRALIFVRFSDANADVSDLLFTI